MSFPEIRQAFTDRKTGMFDAQAAAQQINQIRSIYKSGPRKGANADNSQYEVAKSFWEEEVPQFIEQRLQQKFVTLLANSAYVPKWMAEKENADNSQIASISFVNTPYYTIPDSAAKVIRRRDHGLCQSAPGRIQAGTKAAASPMSLSMPALPRRIAPVVRQQLIDLSKDFATTKDPAGFLNRVGSERRLPRHHGRQINDPCAL